MLRGLFWSAAYILLVVAPLLLMMVGPTPPPGGVLWDFAIALGFAGLAMMGVQFILTARFRRATAPFGVDLVYYFHRYAAIVTFAIVLAHPVLLFIDNPVLLSYLHPLEAPWHMTVGVGSVLALVVVMVTSLWRKGLRLPYEHWRLIHAVLAVAAVVLALLHVHGVGYFVSEPWKRLLWTAIAASWVGALGYVRVVKPWRLLRRPWRVTSVTPERGDAWTLSLEPVGHEGITFQPGQFAWLSIRSSPFAMREHPFSIASRPNLPGGKLEFVIKELGDFTRTIGTVKPGETVYVDGPHGSFTPDRHPAPGYVLVAGGIGIAPLVSMLRTFADRGDRRPHLLVYAAGKLERMPLGEELEALQKQLDLKVVVTLEEPPADWTGESGWLTTELFERHLPENRAQCQVFVCGPMPMIRLAERTLSTAGVPLSRIHSEIFDLV